MVRLALGGTIRYWRGVKRERGYVLVGPPPLERLTLVFPVTLARSGVVASWAGGLAWV